MTSGETVNGREHDAIRPGMIHMLELLILWVKKVMLQYNHSDPHD